MAHGQAIFAAGAAATLAMLACACRLYYVDGVGYGLFMTAFGYSLQAMAFALLVMAALSPRATPLRWHVPGAAPLALWSYSTYLSHKPLAYFLAQQLKPLGVSDGVLLGVVTLACIAAGGLLYTLVEAPFMVLRERWVPSNFRDQRPVDGTWQAVSP